MDNLARENGEYSNSRDAATEEPSLDEEGDIPRWEEFEEQNKNFTIAMTGKAFHYICSKPSMTYTLNKVLLHAKVFARMSPDDKALLVEKF